MIFGSPRLINIITAFICCQVQYNRQDVFWYTHHLIYYFQGPTPSLLDVICAILSSLKSSNHVANMNTIIARLKTDFNDIPAPKDYTGKG